MKITKFAAMALMCLAMAACGGAHAATLTQNYGAADGTVFQVDTANTVEQYAGYVKVTRADGTIEQYADATGTLMYRITESPEFAKHYILIPGSQQKYINTTRPTKIYCSGSSTAFLYPGNPTPTLFADACALWRAVQGWSN